MHPGGQRAVLGGGFDWNPLGNAGRKQQEQGEKLLSAFLSTFLPWQQRGDDVSKAEVKQKKKLLRSVNILYWFPITHRH